MSRKPLFHDAVVIFIASAMLSVSVVFARVTTRWSLSTFFITQENAPLFYWLAWGGGLIGPLAGELLAGFVLGRYLVCIRPWQVIAAIGIYSVGAMIFLLTAINQDRAAWIDSVGVAAACAQLVLHVAIVLLTIWFGAWFGLRHNPHPAEGGSV